MQRNADIDGGNAFDWGQTSKDYAKYRDIYPQEFYNRIIDLGLCKKGQMVLDLGTGTGVLPRNLYRYGAHFVGTDISENQIAEAKRLSQESGMNIKYVVASAENVDFPPNSFNVITACQCFVYFDQKVIFSKMHKLLKNDGYFCIFWMAWLPYKSTIAQSSENLILKYNPMWTGAGFKEFQPTAPEPSKPYFSVNNTISYDIDIPFTRESWNGRIKACRGVGASSLTNEEINQFEKEHIDYLNTVPEQFEIPHNVTILNLKKIND